MRRKNLFQKLRRSLLNKPKRKNRKQRNLFIDLDRIIHITGQLAHAALVAPAQKTGGAKDGDKVSEKKRTIHPFLFPNILNLTRHIETLKKVSLLSNNFTYKQKQINQAFGFVKYNIFDIGLFHEENNLNQSQASERKSKILTSQKSLKNLKSCVIGFN